MISIKDNSICSPINTRQDINNLLFRDIGYTSKKLEDGFISRDVNFYENNKPNFSEIINDCKEREIYEEDRFDKTKKIIEFHQKNGELKDKTKLEGFFVCDFAEIKQNKTLQDSIKEDEHNLKYNLITPLDILKRQNPDLNNEELKKQIAFPFINCLKSLVNLFF